jgi:uncharacterized membrane protein YbaN (DUF454 family)
VRRTLYLVGGGFFFLLGAVGAVLPLLPTVVFWILAAWCFGRSSPRLEAWLLDHPGAGPHIRSWRERGAIGRRAKWLATVALAASSGLGLLTLSPSLALVPIGACLAAGSFIWTRPD